MMSFIKIIAGFLSGVIGGMGLGGGAVLLIYLRVFEQTEQIKAQGINLLFFLPIGAVAVIIYAFKKMIDWKTVLTFVAFGVPGCIGTIMLTHVIGGKYLGKIFAVILIIMGICEIIKGFLLKVKEKRGNIRKE